MKTKRKSRAGQLYERRISLYANKDEIKKFDAIKLHYRRKSDGDMIRTLICQEAEKILNNNTPIGNN